MHIGIVADENPQEHRVMMSPYGVEELVSRGHEVTIEKNVGQRAQFSDADYERAGARITYSEEEAWIRPDMLLRFRPPSTAETERMRDSQIFGGYVELPQIPAPTRPHLPFRWSADACEIGSIGSRCTFERAAYRLMRAVPSSMTYRIPGTVTEDSATFVAITIRRW